MPGKIIGYEVHLARFGWRQGVVYDGMCAGTTGHGLRIEAVIVTGLPPGFQYRAHVAGVGWLSWMNPGETAGTIGESRPLEALQFRWNRPTGVPGEMWGRSYAAKKEWLPVTSGMEPDYIGTTGQGLQMEAIQLWLIMPEEDGISNDLFSQTAAFPKIVADLEPKQQYPNPTAMIVSAAETEACMASLGVLGASCARTEALRCVSAGVPSVAACTAAVTGGVPMFEHVEHADS